MKLSAKSLYGLRACYILAENYGIKEISATILKSEIGVSSKYLEQIMRMLSKRSIVSAKRGASGGYFLSRLPSDILVGEIIRALEDDFQIAPCVSSPCVKCASSNVWKKLQIGINGVLDSITLEDMKEDYCKNIH